MALIKGKQLATGADGVQTANLADGILSADASGRAKIAANFFDSATVSAKFASASIALDRLAEAVIQADGGQAFTADQSLGGFKITNLGTPTAGTDAATKAYADSLANGLDVKASVRLATAAALPANTRTGDVLTADANGALTVDGVAVVLTNRVLVKNEATGANNGIYVVTATGDGSNPFELTRAEDANLSAEVTAGMFTFVAEGTANADTGWVLTTNDPITLNTTALAFTQFSSSAAITAGNGLVQNGQAFDVVIAAGSGGLTSNANDISVNYGGTGELADADAGAEAAGSSELLARADHKHLVSTAAPSVTVKSEATAASAGTATSLLRSDAQIQVATAAPSNVGTANAQGSSSSLARADHTHASPKLYTGDKALNPDATSGDEDDSGLTITNTPALDSYVMVSVNGIRYELGDGVKTKDAFFTADAGTTARAISAITAGDALYWNGVIAGFDLATSDEVDLDYLSF